jgi:hypothetical protein
MKTRTILTALALALACALVPATTGAHAENLNTRIGKLVNSISSAGFEYWDRLSAIINSEPVQEKDRLIMAMLAPLGIEEAKPFNPDARQREVLTEAATAGNAMAKSFSYGSVDLYLGPTTPKGYESNWVKTVADKRFFPMFRRSGLLEPFSTRAGRCRTSRN